MSVIRWVCAVAILASPIRASASEEGNAQWGRLLNDVAKLTWAEEHCSGRASDSLRKLRLHLRESLPADLEEVAIRNKADTRASVPEGLEDKTAVEGMCLAVTSLFGPSGNSMPGLWLPNTSPGSKPRRPPSLVLSSFGEFPQVLAELDALSAVCDGFMTNLASDFTSIFKKAAGEAAFRNLAEQDGPQWLNSVSTGACRRISQDYGEQTTTWPQLWVPRARSQRLAADGPAPPLAALPKSQPSDLDQNPYAQFVTDGDSRFLRLRLPKGVELDLPRGWALVGDELLEVIDTASEAALDLTGEDPQPDRNGRITLLAANSTPASTYAAIRINSTKPLLTASELMSVLGSDATLRAIKAAVSQQENDLLEFRRVYATSISGFRALTIEYQRSGMRGPVHVQINRIVTATQELSVILSYRESEAQLWKPIMERIRRSLAISEQ